MDNLAYLHVAFAYEDPSPSELRSLVGLLENAAVPDWKRLSSGAWKYMLPLALSLSILSAVNSVLALERGDQGPSVKHLQNKLRAAGFYQAPITQVYDARTEDAVRRFQNAAGLDASGVAGNATLHELENWGDYVSVESYRDTPLKLENAQVKKLSPETSVKHNNNRHSSKFLKKGDEGSDVRVLQEKLRIAGYYYGNANGIYGPITEEAVKQFQEAYNLNVDGIVGSATLAKLPPAGVGGGDENSKQPTDDDKLRLGDRGEAVRVLQTQLIKEKYLTGEPNGYYGPNTADAVKRFQADHYLAVSGVAGSTTRAKLYSLVNTSPNKSDFDVLEIQRRLREQGFYRGPLNGVMGMETKKAIKQAQEFYGVSLNDVKSGRY